MLWLHVLLPFTAWRRRGAGLHAPVNWGPWFRPRPTVVTIHDLAWERVPDAFPENFRRYARIFARRSVKRARRGIAAAKSGSATMPASRARSTVRRSRPPTGVTTRCPPATRSAPR